MDRKEAIGSSIDSIANQINLLSNRCKLEENRSKNYSFEHTLEASAIMLQLSKTLGELILIEKALERSDNQSEIIDYLITGRKKNL